MKTKFIFCLTVVVCLLVMFLLPFQSPAEDKGGCVLYCNTNAASCLENTPEWDPGQREQRRAFCENQTAECLARCSHQTDTEAGVSSTVPPPRGN